MYEQAVDSVVDASTNKVAFLNNNPLGYIIASIMAGMFIAFGSFVSMSVGGYCSSLGTIAKLLSSFSFAAALSLVVMCGCELFTGNNMVMGIGKLENVVDWCDVVVLWTLCWFGNFIGSWIAIGLFHFAGADSNALVASSFNSAALTKCSYNILQLVTRGILCNILVCLAVWCSIKMKDETAKLIMVFWCIFVFMICGFEHSIANMSIIGTSLLNHLTKATWTGYFNNLLWVTVGNIIGGWLFVAYPYSKMINRSGQS